MSAVGLFFWSAHVCRRKYGSARLARLYACSLMAGVLFTAACLLITRDLPGRPEESTPLRIAYLVASTMIATAFASTIFAHGGFTYLWNK